MSSSNPEESNAGWANPFAEVNAPSWHGLAIDAEDALMGTAEGDPPHCRGQVSDPEHLDLPQGE